MNMEASIIASLCLLLALTCRAATVYVDDDGPADFDSIQAAIRADTTKDGDRILVAAGQYDLSETLVFCGKNITVKSVEGADVTIIQANGLDVAVRFASGENRDAVLQGFTIKGAWWFGIVCGADPTITENVITDNGSGLFIIGSDALVTKNRIYGNGRFDGHGGGISCDMGSPYILENVIHSNIAGAGGGIACYDGSTAVIERNLIYDNEAVGMGGGGVFSVDSDNAVVLLGNTIVENRACQGGGLFVRGNCRIQNCIVWFNQADQDDNHIETDGSNVSHNNICGIDPDDHGNVSLDPCFADPNNGDFHVKSQAGRWDAVQGVWVQDEVTSPCIDAGDPATPIMHEPFPNGGLVNVGAYGGTAEASKSWFNAPVCEVIVAGDINGDCRVDVVDLALMARNWLSVR